MASAAAAKKWPRSFHILPCSRSRGVDPLPHGRTAIETRHAGSGPAFIDEDQPLGIELGQLLLKGASLGLHLWAIAFLRMQRLLLAGNAETLQRPGNGHQRTVDAQTVAELGQRRIRLRADHFAQALL